MIMLSDYIKLDQKKEMLFERFYELHKDATLNLTAIKNKEDFYIKHYLDSIYIFLECQLAFNTLLDVGTGGGFPGIPIGILYPEKYIYLVESIRKKCKFLEEAIKALNLNNISVINKRVEDLNEPKVDIITARAAGSIKDIIKRTLQLAHKSGMWIIYKGENISDEIVEVSQILKRFNLKIEKIRYEKPFKRSYIIITH